MVNNKYNLLNKNLDINYYESEFYKITLFENKFSDKFYICYDDDKIIVQRIDKNEGWGQNLRLIFRDKVLASQNIINVGSSEENIKIINLNDIFIDTNISFKKIDHLHYENDTFKVFYISDIYDDVYKIDYNEFEKIIKIKRIDKDHGWGQSLKLKYVEKKRNRVKIITIGSSDKNMIELYINFDDYKYENSINHYESENYIITLYELIYQDLFNIIFYEDNNTIYVKRIDKNEGWGQQLKLTVFDKNINHNFIIYIGQSKNNEIYKKINLEVRKCYVSLTTIPSRIKLPVFKQNVLHFLNNQIHPIESMFIVISKKYNRFNEKIPDELIADLQEIPKIVIILLEEDLGPASKYMGPLLTCYDILMNNLLIIIDDDRIYNKNMVRNFVIGYNSFPNITFSSGYFKSYFDKDYLNIDDSYFDYSLYKERNDNTFFFGQGLGGFFGFCIKVNGLEKFIKYNFDIMKRLEKSIFHDEGIILGYLKKREELIIYINHKGCNFIDEEMVDALCKSNLVDRAKIEKQILQVTNFEKIL
jgi:hypothetical protein